LVPAALAANFSINDSVEAQITLTHDANWEFGVLSNGLPFPARAGGTTTVPGEVATFLGSWFVITPGNPNPGSGIIYFVDQAANKHSCQPRNHGHRRHSYDRERTHGLAREHDAMPTFGAAASPARAFVSATSSQPTGAPSRAAPLAERPSLTRSFRAHVAGTWARCLHSSPASEFPTRSTPFKSVDYSVIRPRPRLSQSPLT
jgi:hypothetical protein